jgi:hypothetical protein
MAISIQGIRLKSISVQFDDQGTRTVRGSYDLMSNTGVKLASQTFNGYSDIKVPIQGQNEANANAFIDGMQSEINKQLGLE